MAIEVRGLTPLLEVFDMPTSIAFYCDLLRFEIVTSDGKPAPNFDWVWLRLADADLMLNTAYEAHQRPPAPDPKRIAAHHDTCLYFGCPNPDAAYAYLRERGVKLKPPKVAPYGMKQLYFVQFVSRREWRVTSHSFTLSSITFLLSPPPRAAIVPPTAQKQIPVIRAACS